MPPITPRPPRIIPDLARGTRTVGIGDSIMRGLSSATEYGRKSWFDMGCLMSNQRILRWGNLGADGETTAQILARVDDVIALRPARCVVYGGTNDVIAQYSTATIMANLTALYRTLRGAGIEPIACTILPIYLPAFETTYRAAIQKLNANIAYYAQTNGMHLLDLYGASVDPTTGDFIDGYDTDGEHPHGTGAGVLGALMAEKLAPLYPEVYPWFSSCGTDASNFITNGLFLTDSNADGIADNWSKSGATPTASLVAESGVIVGNWQQLVWASPGQTVLQQNITRSNVGAIGDRIAFGGRVQYETSSGMWCYVTLSFYDATPTKISSLYPLNNWSEPITDGAFWMVTEIPANTNLIQIIIGNGATQTGTLRVGQLTLRNLTTLGVF